MAGSTTILSLSNTTAKNIIEPYVFNLGEINDPSGGVTSLNLPRAVLGVNYINVFLSGIYQNKSTYTIDGNTILFDSLIPNHVTVEIVSYETREGIDVNSFVGDETTVDFTVDNLVNDINKLSVFISGVYQNKSTYNATGTTVTFTTPPPLNTQIEIIHIKI